MRLLKITDQELPEMDEYFENSSRITVEEATPKVVEQVNSVGIGSERLNEFDAIFAQIPKKKAVFGRVLLEMIEDEGLVLNYPSTAFFIMAKKNYLYHVLHEKDIPAPETVVAASEKAVRNVEKYLRGPLVAREFEQMVQKESTKIEKVGEIKEISEGLNPQENIMVFNELSYGDKYRCLVIGDQIISLEDKSETWKITTDNLQYVNLPSDLRDIVQRTSNIIGTNIAEVLIQDGRVVDVNPNPDFEMYTEVSGKNSFESVKKLYSNLVGEK